MSDDAQKENWWRGAAALIAAMVFIIGYVAVGFVEMAAQIFFDKTITVDKGWVTGMVGTSGSAFGYLIGKKSNRTRQVGNRPICDSCPIHKAFPSGE